MICLLSIQHVPSKHPKKTTYPPQDEASKTFPHPISLNQRNQFDSYTAPETKSSHLKKWMVGSDEFPVGAIAYFWGLSLLNFRVVETRWLPGDVCLDQFQRNLSSRKHRG